MYEEEVTELPKIKDTGLLGFHPSNKPPPERKPEKWMSPLNRIIWHKAFKKKATEVTLLDGRKFNLDYKTRSGYVWVSPASKELVPSGWYNLKEVTKPTWIGEQ